jgi:hypothetical protein
MLNIFGTSEITMTDSLNVLYEQAIRKAKKYLTEGQAEINVKFLIEMFLTTLLDSGYGIAPIEPTAEMIDETDPDVIEYHRTIYRKMIARRPRLNL